MPLYRKTRKKKAPAILREWLVKRHGRYLTFNFGSQYTDYPQFAGLTTEAQAKEYLERGSEYEIEKFEGQGT